MVLDGRLAFIGGMNLRRVDWDTSAHRVFDARRMLLASTTEARMAVAAREQLPDNGPRKDYIVRIEGPAARDAEDIFHRRWRYLLDTRARFSDDASDFTVAPTPAPVANGVQAQVTATLPAPFHEYAIAESWVNAINQAQSYIFIEDQYFRIPMLNELIMRRMTEVPTLRLLVVTKPINEWVDPGCPWTYRSHGEFAMRFPTRYRLVQLRAFDTQVTWGFDETDCHFVDMDVHSKMLIVDDEFMSVGSCNKNNRGSSTRASSTSRCTTARGSPPSAAGSSRTCSSRATCPTRWTAGGRPSRRSGCGTTPCASAGATRATTSPSTARRCPTTTAPGDSSTR
jgi:phospholipase D1/2